MTTNLESTQKDTCGEKLLPVLHETHAKLNEAPCEDEERKPVANSQLTEDDVSGELAVRKRDEDELWLTARNVRTR